MSTLIVIGASLGLALGSLALIALMAAMDPR